MFEPRSDEQIIKRAPVVVTLGERQYEVKVLAITPAEKWRQRMIDELSEIMQQMQAPASSIDVLAGGLGFAFLAFPQKMRDLVFAYATEIPREQAEAEATDEQLARAFSQIVQVAFPFVGQLGLVTQAMSVAQSFQGSGKSTK